MFVNVNTYRQLSKIWPDCATRILEENQYTTTEETCPSQYTVPALTHQVCRTFFTGSEHNSLKFSKTLFIKYFLNVSQIKVWGTKFYP